MIWLTSDLHLFHNRTFIYENRGFSSIEAMNEVIEKNWNDLIHDDDEVYVLGDLMVGGKAVSNDVGMEVVRRLKGRKHIIIGNHDTIARIQLYRQEESIVEVQYALLMRYKGRSIYMSHFPTFTSDPKHEDPDQWIINFFGHTHTKERFFEGLPFMYNVALDAHEMKPVALDEALAEIKKYYSKLSPSDMPTIENAATSGLNSLSMR